MAPAQQNLGLTLPATNQNQPGGIDRMDRAPSFAAQGLAPAPVAALVAAISG